MGENEVMEATALTAAPPTSAEKPVVKAPLKKTKKKDKKPLVTIEAVPHVTGRLLHMEAGTSGVTFAIKGKKGKVELFSLSGMELSSIPAAAAMLAGLVVSKTKLRVEFSMTSDNSRTIKKIHAHS